MRGTIPPFADVVDLLPEASTEPGLTPRAAILHTFGSPGRPEGVRNYFGSPTVVTEAHWAVGFDGRLHVWLPVSVQADAHHDANGFAVAIETEDGGNPATPWTQAQCVTIARGLRWLKEEWQIPLTRCLHAQSSGVGYHAMFPAWNRRRHACPGIIRVGQLFDYVLPLATLAGPTPIPKENAVLRPTYVTSICRVPSSDGKPAVLKLQAQGGVISEGKPKVFYGSMLSDGMAKHRVAGVTYTSIEWLEDIDGGAYAIADDQGHIYVFTKGLADQLKGAGRL